MASGRLEVSLSLAGKRASKSQLGSVLLLACSGISWAFLGKVFLGQTISAAGIQMDQTTSLVAPARVFADSFHYEPAGNIMAFSDHTQR